IRNFQLRNSLTVDGVADARTREVLLSDNAIANPDAAYPELRVGSQEPAVLRLEVRLQDLNYLRGQIPDEAYDASTEAAISNFQQRNNLPVNGVATVQTQEVLYSANAVAESNAPAYQDLRNGDRDAAVETLERRLQELNYFQGQVPDNQYDANTETAVRNFQTRNSLPVNGVATVQTQESLYSNTAIPNSGSSVNPEQPPSSGGQQATVTTNGTAAIALTGPGFDFNLAGDVPNGTVVTLTGDESNNWYELQDGRWVYGDYLTFN
ncbi:MAG: peptidoglycan-binding protein, partial [Cyanobacteria bacterium P01_H01_bin.152]